MKEKDMKRRKAEKQAELSEKKVRMPMLSKKNKIKMRYNLIHVARSILPVAVYRFFALHKSFC